MFQVFLKTSVMFFFLLTPFFLLSTFLSMTQGRSFADRKQLAVRVTIAVVMISLVLFFIGNTLFNVLGITLHSFRVGTGVLLFLSAVALVQGTTKDDERNASNDIAVVPLAMPVTVGPATTGTLLVMGSELQRTSDKLIGVAALCAAIVSVGILLYLSSSIEKVLTKQGLAVLSKITGLVLSAMAAQMVMTGILGFFRAQ